MKRLLVILLIATSLAAQKPAPFPLAPSAGKPSAIRPHIPQATPNDPHGIWDAPKTFFDFWWEELTGRLIWRHYKVFYPPLPGRRLYCKVENMTHHLPEYFDHDPRNLVLTPTSFEFDAVAGDLIAWKVWSQ